MLALQGRHTTDHRSTYISNSYQTSSQYQSWVIYAHCVIVPLGYRRTGGPIANLTAQWRSGSMDATRPIKRSCLRQASNFWSVVISEFTGNRWKQMETETVKLQSYSMWKVVELFEAEPETSSLLSSYLHRAWCFETWHGSVSLFLEEFSHVSNFIIFILPKCGIFAIGRAAMASTRKARAE